MSEGTTARDAQTELTPEEIFDQLNQPYSGTLPVDALRAAQARREEITPFLIKLIQDATRALTEGDLEPAEREGPLLALYLLAEFRAKEALPVILDALSLPGDAPNTLFGSAISSDLARMLCVLAEDRLDLIAESIDNQDLDEFVRWAMASVFQYLVRDKKMTREDAVGRLRGHLITAIEKEDEVAASMIVCELVTFAPREAQAEIEQAFERNLVDNTIVDQGDVRRSIKNGDSWCDAHEVDLMAPSEIDDTVEELSGWYCYLDYDDELDEDYDPDESDVGSLFNSGASYEDEPPLEPVGTIRNTEPRIGRNQPCPCGSGKKFKKCCGRP